MGRATIAGGGTDGLYNVTVDYGAAEISAQTSAIDQQIADRQGDLADAVAAVAATDAAFATAVAAADVAIDLYAADPTDERRQAMNAAAQELARISGERRVAEARRASLATIILSLQADRAQLQAVRTSETRAAWCVDYTEDAAGEVATIEVPGEVGTLVIAPGGRPPTAADGKLVARGAQASYQCYYNAAILPGWQRFVHPYRVGTLTAKTGDTGIVNLDAATSSAAGIQVRDAETITAPIQYMTCNGEVFEPGDRVVVDMRGPTIIGFESNPKQCGMKWPDLYFQLDTRSVATAENGPYSIYAGPISTPCTFAGGASGSYDGYFLAGQRSDTTRTVAVVAVRSSAFSAWAGIDVDEHLIWSATETRSSVSSVAQVAEPVGYVFQTTSSNANPRPFRITQQDYDRLVSGDVVNIVTGNDPATVSCEVPPTGAVWTDANFAGESVVFESAAGSGDEGLAALFNWASPHMPYEIEVTNSEQPDEPARTYRIKEARRPPTSPGFSSRFFIVYEEVEP